LTAAAPSAGPAPSAPKPGDDGELAGRIVADSLAATDAELDDAYAGLAALLFDLRAARAIQGEIRTPTRG
jgi:hypothetical protein